MDRPPDILLAEDDDEDAELAFAALELAGLAGSARRARDGEEVLEFLNGVGRHAGRKDAPLPKVVLLDLKMPRVSGFDVLKEVKRSPRLSALPVVVLSSSRDERDVARCYDLGVNSYVVKPVGFEEYSRAIGRVAAYWVQLNICAAGR